MIQVQQKKRSCQTDIILFTLKVGNVECAIPIWTIEACFIIYA